MSAEATAYFQKEISKEPGVVAACAVLKRHEDLEIEEAVK